MVVVVVGSHALDPIWLADRPRPQQLPPKKGRRLQLYSLSRQTRLIQTSNFYKKDSNRPRDLSLLIINKLERVAQIPKVPSMCLFRFSSASEKVEGSFCFLAPVDESLSTMCAFHHHTFSESLSLTAFIIKLYEKSICVCVCVCVRFVLIYKLLVIKNYWHTKLENHTYTRPVLKANISPPSPTVHTRKSSLALLD